MVNPRIYSSYNTSKLRQKQTEELEKHLHSNNVAQSQRETCEVIKKNKMRVVSISPCWKLTHI